ncbi:unnamed protein product [Adineta steineri]|uniref:Peptidase C1A papain C-terminal domain-containing protein n=1 Tax=Adineta steineri TaxID=433720 RepID=A0A819GFP6_9BILA|nr:unnamed protein product [Adineta steineri]CAF3810100.1 unnamed protein product [Adineta steineri]CAF3881187.1 unnamed protein product [Adineta steineri]
MLNTRFIFFFVLFEIKRKQIFIENLNEIHSFQQSIPHATYTLAINHLSDRRIQELVSSRRNTLKSYTSSFKSTREVKTLPESLDWRDKELVKSLHAIETGKLIAEDFPTAPGRCQPVICKPFASFDPIKRMTKPDENQMLEWIQESTLWAEMTVARKGFNTYTGGIYDDPSCSNHTIDDAVQIVGYGSEEGKSYWLCKNYWGTG